MPCRSRRRWAFTLIELLICVAIIVVLIALMLPALERARAQARTVVCRSNLRQLAIAGVGYESDWDGYYLAWGEHEWINSPTDGYQPGIGGYGGSWMSYVAALTNNNPKIFNCPVSNLLRPADEMKSTSGGMCNYAYDVSFGGYMAVMKKQADGVTPVVPHVWLPAQHKYTKLLSDSLLATENLRYVRQEQVISFVDGRWMLSGNTIAPSSDYWQIPWSSRYVHPNSTMNAAFCDGRVESLTVKQVYTNLPWYKGLCATKSR